jgi:hypothetical protein
VRIAGGGITVEHARADSRFPAGAIHVPGSGSGVWLALTDGRTSLASRLIPVSAYRVTSCIEAFLRYTELMADIDAALPADEIGRRARRPGCRINTVSLWSIANFWLLGRKVMAMVDPAAVDDVEAADTVLDFWDRAARGFRGDGTRQAWDSGAAAVYGAPSWPSCSTASRPSRTTTGCASAVQRHADRLLVPALLRHASAPATRARTARRRPGAAGAGLLPAGRQRLLVVGRGPAVPYRNLTAALVLDGVRIDRITDFGTTYTTPESYLDHLVGFGLFTTDGQPPGEPRPVPLTELDAIVAAVRRRSPPCTARRGHGSAREDPLRRLRLLLLPPALRRGGRPGRCGLDRAEGHPGPLYELVSAMEGDNAGVEDDGPYYARWRDLPWAAADELRHADAGAEEWTFSFWTADGSAGGLVLLRLLPAIRTCWYWAALVRAGQPLLHVTDWEAPLPRVGLAVRSEGLWADHVCEAPYEQWTVANETYAVALDDPADALGRAFGMSAPMAFDLEWYATSAPTAVRDGYEQQGEVHGVVS